MLATGAKDPLLPAVSDSFTFSDIVPSAKSPVLSTID